LYYHQSSEYYEDELLSGLITNDPSGVI